jgi:hypothetical protein
MPFSPSFHPCLLESPLSQSRTWGALALRVACLCLALHIHLPLAHSTAPCTFNCPLHIHLPLAHSPAPCTFTCPLPIHLPLAHSPAPCRSKVHVSRLSLSNLVYQCTRLCTCANIHTHVQCFYTLTEVRSSMACIRVRSTFEGFAELCEEGLDHCGAKSAER